MRRRMPAMVAAAVIATSLTTPVAVAAGERGDDPSAAGSAASERSAAEVPDSSKMSDSHGGACSTNPENPRLINTTSPTLRAYVRDRDSQVNGEKVKVRFEWKIGGEGDRVGYVDTPSTDVATWPDGSERSAKAKDLPEHKLIGYRAAAHDRTEWGPWSDWCYLEVSTARPAAPPKVTSEDYPEGHKVTDGVGRPGEFTFSANGVADAAAYHYGFGGSCTTTLTPSEPGGTVTTTITPRSSGPHTIYARTTNAYGGSSACEPVYTFTVAPLSDPVAYFPLDEGKGKASADIMEEGRSVTASGGVEWTRGRVGAVENPGFNPSYRRDGSAIATDGEGGRLSTKDPVVDTSATFSVAAWVRLDDPSRDHIAVSQQGNRRSGFYLGYEHRDGDGAWVFKTAADEGSSSDAIDARVYSSESADAGVWTHLLGVFDSKAGELTLYVDGIKQGTAQKGSRWDAAGAFVIGGAKFDGKPYGAWSGGIDDVRVWDRVVHDEPIEAREDHPETWRLANRWIALEGRWQLDESSGTAVEDSTDHGLTGTLHGEPATAWGHAENDTTFSPGVRLNGVDERITTDRPAVRTDRSFSVAAWVRADERSAGADATAVSQDGSAQSGFYLGKQETADGEKWVFTMTSSDQVGADAGAAAVSRSGVAPGRWTHLAGTYDRTTGEMTLYVDGIQAATAVQDTPWHADGPLVMGAARLDERLAQPWHGDIDDVQIYQGIVDGTDVASIRAGAVAFP